MYDGGHLKGSFEAVSGHSEHVTTRIREQNSLDHDLHTFSKQLWREKLAQLKQLKGEPACEIECAPAEVEATCIEAVAGIEKTHNVLFDSDEFRSVAGAHRFKCPVVPTPLNTDNYTRGPLSRDFQHQQHFCYGGD